VLVVPDGQGGAWAEIDQVELGETYIQPTTFFVFLLPFNLPGADIPFELRIAQPDCPDEAVVCPGRQPS